MWLGRALVGFCVVIAAGCGDDRGGVSASDSASESGSGSGSSGEPSATTAAPTDGSASATEGDDAGSMSESLSGTTEISGGMSASMSGSEDSGDESSSTGSSSTGMVSGSGETSASSSSTGEPIDCAEFATEDECLAADCMAIVARPFFDDQATWCLDPPSFLACAPQAVCDAAITTACKGQAKYQFKNGCLAPGFMICPAPPDAGGDGYADCP